MTSSISTAGLYDAYYFQHGCGRPYQRDAEWLKFFGGIADKIVANIAPRTALDAGCAMGFLVEALRDRGVDAYGIDISDYAIGQVREDIRPYCRVGSLTDSLPGPYGLIVCIEVLEHLRQSEAEQAIAHFCQATDDILFSSTPMDYREATHFNVQSPEYWAQQFAEHNFVRDVDFDASFINPWAVRFRRNHEALPRVVANYERRFWSVWKENVDLRALAVEQRDQLAAGEQAREALRVEHDQVITNLHERTRAVETHLQAITHSPSWKVLQVIRRGREWLAPPGSRRATWLDQFLRAVFRA